MAQIQQGDHPTGAETHTGGRRRWGKTFLAVSVLATAAAGWAVVPRGGNVPEPVFVGGDTWELIVGEESNGGDGTFKVCHSFRTPDLAPTDGNGLGGAGCETSPDDAPPGAVIAEVAPAIATPTGVVILVNLTTTPVAEVILTANTGETLRLAPFVMPQSGEQFVAAELSGTPASVEVEALGPGGGILERRVVTNLVVR